MNQRVQVKLISHTVEVINIDVDVQYVSYFKNQDMCDIATVDKAIAVQMTEERVPIYTLSEVDDFQQRVALTKETQEIFDLIFREEYRSLIASLEEYKTALLKERDKPLYIKTYDSAVNGLQKIKSLFNNTIEDNFNGR